ncbi:MAG: DUF3369 domain-containing protein [Magnetococcales bacterium]|nr:DUF3369 domain-containing protein [Magnetococcales bacterium]MBF0438377.1 DUF3369 domain-containing protein [Magnetococcales bacterium]
MNDLVFADDDVPHSGEGRGKIEESTPWKLMIVDDDADVHALSCLVLRHFSFEGRKLTFVHGHSRADAERLMQEHPDTAVLLLDVVMESDQSGLEAVRFIRETLKNRFVRIILRTGQPGYAPEQRVIMDYDINDYKEKTDLTDIRLITALVTSLRSYRDMMIIEKNRQGLKKIIHATGSLFEPRSVKKLATGVLTQLVSILGLDESALYAQASGFAISGDAGGMLLYAGTGRFTELIGQPVEAVADETMMTQIHLALKQQQSVFENNVFVGYFRTRQDSVNLLYLKGIGPLGEWDEELIRLYATNVGLAFDNILMNREIFATQQDLTFTLGELIEGRSNETGNHVRRVAEFARLLGTLAGLNEDEVEMLWLAAPLHDLGKFGIPEEILKKPSSLNDGEWALMKDHAELGMQMLKGSNRKILQLASIIAVQHHERWDGGGYPQGLKEEEIHLYARIVSLVEVFDALAHERLHKKAWSLESTLEFIRNGRSKRFDPRLVDLFLENLDGFLRIQDRYTDLLVESAAS